MEARETLLHFSKFLLESEKLEILDFETIYYINTFERPISSPDGPENDGFDNDK
jgi:hypothetical protein